MTFPLRQCPRVVVAAPHGRSGKTTVTLGLVAALVKRGLSVQPFKKGPDYIDPGWLSLAAGMPCRNLDAYMMGMDGVRKAFAAAAWNGDIAVVEGAMGLFDGLDLAGSGSTAEIAKALSAPVLLVVDTTRMTRSVAALVSGFQGFDPAVQIGGVILNRVARCRHEDMLRRAVEEYCGLPVLGALPKGQGYDIPDRHLGLIPAGESGELTTRVAAALDAIGRFLDLDAILAVAGRALPLPPGDTSPQAVFVDGAGVKRRPWIGVFRDRAFSFYYPENLAALTQAGADLVVIDATCDRELPDVDALYLGGGFPEVQGRDLETNGSLREAVRRAVEDGLPVYAECGGLMYLGRSITWRDQTFRMCGALPFEVEMVDGPQGHGYVAAQVVAANPFFPPGTELRGHEFHHSRVINLERDRVAVCLRLSRGTGIGEAGDGLVYRNVLASYTHIHALGVPGWAKSLVDAARWYHNGGATSATLRVSELGLGRRHD
ncbi:MAG TPA: cobyrinate a,c-diamide synthase [Spirochaetia bacterium]|nr:cobyrinate a,c-diamide synthase [Spirochaetia bacterium]